MKTLHTIEYAQDGLTIKATQQYNDTYKGGSYYWVITNGAGHIVRAGHTASNVPDNKLSTKELADMLKREARWLDDEDREFYGLPTAAE